MNLMTIGRIYLYDMTCYKSLHPLLRSLHHQLHFPDPYDIKFLLKVGLIYCLKVTLKKENNWELRTMFSRRSRRCAQDHHGIMGDLHLFQMIYR